MERCGAAATGEYRRAADGPGRSVCADTAAASPSLLLDGYSARRRGCARFEARIFKFAIFYSARGGVLGILSSGGTGLTQVFSVAGQGWQPALYDRYA